MQARATQRQSLATPLTLLLLLLIALLERPPAASADTLAPCSETTADTRFSSAGWGNDLRNTRYAADSQITRANVGTLRLQWSFALPGGQSPHSYPLTSQDTLFIGSQAGTLFALDRATGCTRWQHQTKNSIRTGLTHGVLANGAVLFFGTGNGEVEAVAASDGTPRWQIDVRDHPAQFVTGTPVFHAGILYVPISSREVGLAMSPLYGCCTSRGAIVALDAATGKERWRTHSIDEAPAQTGRRWLFIESWGPSGAPVWSAPTIDTRRGLLLFGSGENYSAPTSAGSDAITALDLATGERRWRQQYTELDAFNMACTLNVDHPNCPKENGPDLDFGAPPMLARLANSQEVVLAGQKSGVVHAIDPASGVHLWSRNIGRGGYLGGVHWGMAGHEPLQLLFAPISDIRQAPPGSDQEPAPGLSAIDMATGDVRWQVSSVANCEDRTPCLNGYSAAPVANAELVFLGGLDGWLHAFAADNGDELWRFNSWRTFDAVNATDELGASGGSIDVHGPLLSGQQLFVQSGYGSFGQAGGNALLAFSVAADSAAAAP